MMIFGATLIVGAVLSGCPSKDYTAPTGGMTPITSPHCPAAPQGADALCAPVTTA